MKRIIIYGASSGIGKALACMYAEQGDKVAVAARRIDNLKEMQRQFPNNLIPFQVDVTDNSREQFREMVEALQGADLVVYCSGLPPGVKCGQHLQNTFPTCDGHSSRLLFDVL